MQILDGPNAFAYEHGPALWIKPTITREHNVIRSEEIQSATQCGRRAIEHGVSIKHFEILDEGSRKSLEYLSVVLVRGARAELSPKCFSAPRKKRQHAAAVMRDDIQAR